MQPRILYITGADAKYFSLVFPLLSSFEMFCPGQKMMVCDFGMTSVQKQFYADLGILLPRPSHLADDLHPYLAKAAMYEYVKEIPFDVLVWIDSDMIVTAPLQQALSSLVPDSSGDGAFVYACPDSVGTMGNLFRIWKEDVAPFRELFLPLGMPDDTPYFNSAFFMINDLATLQEMADITLATPVHRMIDQNIFNYVAYKNFPAPGQLDSETWNAHDLLLNQLTVSAGDGRVPFKVMLGERQVRIVHATSIGERAVKICSAQIPVGQNMIMTTLFRRVLNEAVNRLFITLFIHFAKRHLASLQALELIQVAANPRSSDNAPGQQ